MKRYMIGRELTGHYYREDQTSSRGEKVALEVSDLSLGDKFTDVNFKLYEGEILGIGGLTDCGMHELCKVIFGAMKPDKGAVTVSNQHHKISSTEDAVANKIAYLPKDRDQESLFLNASIEDNIVLPSVGRLKTNGMISKKKENQLAEENADLMSIKMRNVKQQVRELSGGNKQKVVVAKWVANDSEILIMDCPTRGIDIGVKANIYSLMEEFKKSGKAIIMVSEEMPELLGMSDRIIVMKDGKMTDSFERSADWSEDMILQKMI